MKKPFHVQSEEVINNWYHDILGVRIDYSKMSWHEQRRLDELVERQLENDTQKEMEAFSKMSPKEQRKSNLESRLIDLALEPTNGKPIHEVETEDLEKVLRNLKKLVK